MPSSGEKAQWGERVKDKGHTLSLKMSRATAPSIAIAATAISALTTAKNIPTRKKMWKETASSSLLHNAEFPQLYEFMEGQEIKGALIWIPCGLSATTSVWSLKSPFI